MKGYDEYNTILLPPRKAGDQLRAELSEHFYEQAKSVWVRECPYMAVRTARTFAPKQAEE